MDLIPNSEISPIQIDFQTAVTTSIASWQDQVLAGIASEKNRDEWELRRNACFQIPQDPTKARDLTKEFNIRVSQVESHLSSMFPPDELMILRLNFSQNDRLQTLNWNENNSKPEGTILAKHIYLQCEKADWTGKITLDLSQVNNDQLIKTSDYFGSNFHHTLQTAYRKGKKLLLVIDGYGKDALEKGFLMYQGIPQLDKDEYRQVLLRTAEGQEQLDSGYGSPWGSANWNWVDSNSTNEASPINPPHFDEARFNAFASTITTAIGNLQRGNQVAVRFPFQFGKTTMLAALAKVELPGIIIGEISSADGKTLVNLIDGRPIQKGEIGDDKQLIIVNEAGRESAEATIGELERSGKKVLRIYPTDGTPPEGYELIEQAK